MIYINDTRPLNHKLNDLTDETLLDRMEKGLRQFSNFTDPCGVMSSNWLWNRWIRNKEV